MNAKKIFGWVLLIASLAVIITALYFSYAIFTGRMKAPEIFKPESNPAAVVDFDQEGFERSLEESIQEQIKNIVPSEFTAQLFNLVSWSIFAGLLMFGGAKISAIGIKMIRKDS